MNESRRENTSEQTSSETIRARRWFPSHWTMTLPLVTFVLFAALTLLSLVELRGIKEPRGAVSVEEISREVVARYKEESQALEELRRSSRANLAPADFLAIFGIAAERAGEKASFPSRAKLLADFQALRRVSPGSAETILRGLVRLWGEALSDEGRTDYELGLLEDLFLQCAVSLEDQVELSARDRDDLFDLAEVLAAKDPLALRAVLPYLRRTAVAGDVERLRALGERLSDPQLRVEVERLVLHLRGREVGELVDAG